MGVFLTNTTNMSYSVEATPGVLEALPDWYQLEPDAIGGLGATITTTPRNPISKKRMDKKGSTTDLDSAVDFSGDLTFSSFNDFIEGFMYSVVKTQIEAIPTSTTTSSYEHLAGTALAEGSLIFVRDFVDSENNGLKVVDAASTTTSTIVVETLVVDAAPATAAKFDIVGFQGVAGDIVVDASGDLTSTTYNFSTGSTDFYVGQWIYIGGTAAGTFFDVAGSGFARITKVEAQKLSIDKEKSLTWGVDAGAAKTIQIFTGSFVRNVPACDADFVSRTYQFEAEYTDAACTTTNYEYALGNSANSMTINVPLSDKATVDWGFIGLDTTTSDTQKPDGTLYQPYDTTAYNTTSDVSDVYLAKEDGTELAAFFKSLTLTLDNGVSAVKVLGTLGGVGVNLSNFTVTGSAQILFDDLEAIDAVRENATVTLDFNLSNDDGAIYFDIPSMTLGNANKSFDRDEEIKLDIDGNAFEDNIFGYVLGVTMFPYTPV